MNWEKFVMKWLFGGISPLTWAVKYIICHYLQSSNEINKRNLKASIL